MAEESTRTKMIREAKVDEDMPLVKKAVRAITLGGSQLLDKLGITQEKEYADKTKEELEVKKAKGGMLKDVDADANPGLAKLPTKVRNKMGYKRSGGSVKTSGYRKVADGVAKRGKTKGRMV